ncbi:MAG: 1-acyl-sn-glycerol-3-phosphate acyltransferase [Planctomycetaceae bacterium]|nr:1-acyl-sn-glycerol-3-phosphate acyltransferase [Planctomycetaceae bacterium]
MNRYTMLFAPQAWKPNVSPALVKFLRPFRDRQRKRAIQISDIQVEGASIVQERLNNGEGVMIMPNHSSHADPYVIYSAADQVGTALHVMATWHVFDDKSWLARWILTKHGCFSVDREANDIGAFRLATSILQEKPEPLVIFPEGEIYHCNGRVTPFREGAAAIAVAAARKSKRPITCIPCAIRYNYVDDPTPSLLDTMSELETSIFWRPKTNEPLEKRIYEFAEVLLMVKELEYLKTTQSGRLPDRIASLREHILAEVEQRNEIASSSKSIPERVKAARKTIMEKELAGDSDTKQANQLNHDMEDLFLVVQSFSYPGDYVDDHPSIDRMAETIDKFEEDVLQKTTADIKAERRVKVSFGEPVEVSSDRKVKSQTTTITATIEQRVQEMLDQS